MSSLSRRNFLYAGGAAAVGAAAAAGPLSHASAAGTASPQLAEVFEPEGTDQLVMYVRNTGSGEVAVLTDGHEVVFTDAQLVARVQRAAKKAAS